MKKSGCICAVLACVIGSAGCSSNSSPTGPSSVVAQTQLKTAPTADPTATPTPQTPPPTAAGETEIAPGLFGSARGQGPTADMCSDEGYFDKAQITPSADGNFYLTFHLTKIVGNVHLNYAAFHDGQAGCHPSTALATAATGFRLVAGSTDYTAGQTATLVFRIELGHYTTGSTQYDVNINGNIFAIVFGYLKDTPTPTPVPVPDPPAVPLSTDCQAGLIFEKGHSVTLGGEGAIWTFSVAKGFGLVVSLVAYEYTSPGVFLPQTFVAGKSGTFRAGGPYSLTVPIRTAQGYQVDGLCGGFKPEALDWNVWESDYRARTMDYTYDSNNWAPANIASLMSR
jgi:hypothetical protein